LQSPYVDKQASCTWLQKGSIYPETEGFAIAIQDQVIATNNYKKVILKEAEVVDRCRKCGKTNETIAHIINGCSKLAPEGYKVRHDNVAKIIHQEIVKKALKKTEPMEPYYKYIPNSIEENERYKILWDRTVKTDKEVTCNRPDIIIWDKENRKIQLIDVAIPNSSNLQSTYEEKINKYRQLSQQMKNVWKAEKIDTIPIVISSTGLIHKELQRGLEKVGVAPGSYGLMQKSVIISTCSLVREFLSD